MLATRKDCTLRLPDGWPRRVRSAVVHAISLAHASLTATRGWAANSWNAYVGLQVENKRLGHAPPGHRPLPPGRHGAELTVHFSWYNGHRPHARLGGATPDEVYHRLRPAGRAPRFEPHPQWPRRSPCASPHDLIRGRPGAWLGLDLRFLGERRHLPLVTLKRVA